MICLGPEASGCLRPTASVVAPSLSSRGGEPPALMATPLDSLRGGSDLCLLLTSASTSAQRAAHVFCSSAGSLSTGPRGRGSRPGRCRLSSAGASAETNGRACGRAALHDLRPRRQIGREPVDRLFPPAGLGLIVERRVILALAATGQRRGAGGVVAVLDLHVLGQLRLSLEGLGPEAGRSAVEFLVVAELGEAECFGGVRRLGLADQDRWQLAVELDHPLGLVDPLRGGITPVRVLRAQLVTPFELGKCLDEATLLAEHVAKVAMGFGVVGLEPQRLAVLGDRLVQLPLVLQVGAEAVVVFGAVGLEPDRFAELGDRLVQLPWSENRAMPRS